MVSMTRRLLLRVAMISISLALSGVGCQAPAASPDETKEPPAQYKLTIGDKSVHITEGNPVQLEGAFNNPRATFCAEPYRTFALHGISFQYPRAYTFEADLSDPAAKCWTLSGPTCVLMVFVVNGKVTAANYADEVMGHFGRDKCTVADPQANITLGTQKLHGISLKTKIATATLMQNIYVVSSGADQTRLLVVQDTLDDQGRPSQDRTTAVEVLANSFELK